MSVLKAVRSAAFAGGLALATAPSFAADPEFSWDMPNVFSRTSSDGVADVTFAELVAEKTNGRIKIVHHFDGSLGYKGVDHLTAVQEGGVPIARHALSYYGGYDPMFLLSTLPFLLQDQEDLNVMHEVSQPSLKQTFEKYNQVVVSAGIFPPSGIWSRQPVENLAALQGLKIRAFDLNSLNTFTGAGAAAVNMNWGDVMPALNTGAIDAVVTSADLGISSGLEEYLPNFTEINWAIPISAVTINKEVWDALPEDLQKAVLEAGTETTRRTFERLGTQVAKNYEDMRAKKVNVIVEPAEDLVTKLNESAEPVIADWRTKAGAGAAVLDQYLAKSGGN
ncbi:MAG: TRAP transporter substrate-binding protein [Rhizobiales bacterium]|nr:TRAP transporter substrate-binding protein [Hyphomicrobiales bacterium]